MVLTINHFTVPSVDLDFAAVTATDILPLLTTELANWIAIVNNNVASGTTASGIAYTGNANKQLTLLKDYTDNTGATRGWVMQCGYGDGVNSFIWAMLFDVSTSTGNLADYFVLDFSDWTDDGSNNGYGDFSNVVASDTSVSWYNTNSNSDFLVAFSADPGQEFFALGWYHRIGSLTNFSDWWMLSKDHNDNWFWVGLDATGLTGLYQQSAAYNPVPLNILEPAFDTDRISFPIFANTTPGNAAFGYSGGDTIDLQCIASHPQIRTCRGTEMSFGGFLTNGTDQYYGLAHYYLVLKAD